MDFSTIILLFIVILNTGLASLILLSNYKDLVNKFFTGLIFSNVLWMVSLYFSNFYGIYSLLWTRLTFLGAVLISIFLLYFSFYFPKSMRKLCWWQHILLFLPVLFITYELLFTNNIIAGITIISTGTGVEQGGLYIVWPIYFICYIIFSFFNLIYRYFHSKDKQRKQIQIVFVGLSLSMIITVTTNLIFPLVFKNDNLSNYGFYSTLIFIAFTAFAIVRYQLMEIKVITTETLVVAINIALLFNALLAGSLLRALAGWALVVLGVVTGYLLIKSVLNEIKQKEQLQVISVQLAEANTHLKDLDKMKTEFVSLASHELLTPVSAIEGYLSMMLDEKLVTLEDPKAVQYMDRVYRSAKRLARLIADMLNISRIEEGRLAVEKKDVDMTETIKQVLEELKFKADEHKQKIIFAGQNTNNQHMTYGDPDKIKEILVNIIGNSIKYTMNPGTIMVTLEKVPTRVLTSKWDKMEAAIMTQPVDNQESIHAVADEHMKKILGDEQYLIRIKDEGIGIPKDELPKLFRKFHRVGDFSTAESQGTGLGLYITRALVELHHGRVWPDSEGQGKGSTFTFSLPTYDAKKEIIALEAQTPQTKEQLKPLAKPMSNDDAL